MFLEIIYSLLGLFICFLIDLPEIMWDVFMSDPEKGNPYAFDIPANKVPWWFI